MPVAPLNIPLDLTGTAPTNLFTNELVQFNTTPERFFIPSNGPFYTTTLEIRHGVTNVLLQPDTQYKILHLHREASLASGKEVCVIIAIVDPIIPSVRIKYQAIGGIYSSTATVIQDLLDNNPIDPSDIVSWQSIFGAPVQFPPTEHLHHFDNIYGAEEIVAVLERLRMAIAAGDSPAISAIYQYVHTLLTNLNYATMNDVQDLLGGESVQYIRTYKTFNDLRAEEFLINNESYLYVATGKETVNDKNGRVFMWDITSTLSDDDKYVIRPSIISTVNPGRFIACLRYADRNGDVAEVFEHATPAIGTELGTHSVNIDMQNLAFQTLWDILYKYGIQNAIGSANTIPDGVDLHTVTEPGKYWFDDSQVNRPFNWGMLEVELVGGTIASPSEVLHTARWDGRVATCSRNSLGVWSDWRFIKNRDIGNERLLIGVDLGAITEDDNYACTTCTNAPETYGILTVKRETSVLIYQTFHSRTNTVYTRTTSDGGVTWTLWKHCVESGALGTAPKEINLGVTIKYFGNNSALVPNYIGENDFATVDVTVFISGEYKTIPLGDIALKFSADDGVISPNGGFGYVYLIDNAGVYTLETNANFGPDPTPLGSYTNKRQVLCWPGEDPKTSNKIFIGIVQRGDDRYTKVRNWYQDPGMCKHFAITENSPQNIHLLPTVNGPVVKMGLLRDAKVVGTAQDYFYSDYYGETLNRVTFLAWAGERIDISLNAEVALQVASAVLRGARIRLGVLHPAGSTVCVTEAGLLNHSIANAHTNTILQHIHLSDSFVAPVTGMYSLLLTGWTNNADATLFIKGSDGNDDFTTTSLKAVLNQVHAYRSLVFKDVAGDPEVLTITVMTSLRNVQLSSLFIAEHGSFASHPLLGEIILNVPNGIVIGSDYTNQPALYVDWAVPEGVTIRLRIVGIVMGKGGKGGDPQTGVVVTAEKGGDAILSVRPLIIEETGVIAGGGGGGGPGSQNGAPVGVGYGGSGGGGGGDSFGVGGTAQGGAGNGSPGGSVVGGNGGNGIQSPLSGGDSSVGGNGGKGGDLGQPGSSGTAGVSHYGVTRAGAGGAAGKAIVSSQPVSFPNGQGFIHGAIDAIIV